MTVNKVILITCGSFNPPTNMHLRMFELARDYLHRLGTCMVVGGIISPVHDAYGKDGLEPAHHRLAMVNLALQTTDWIKLSNWEVKQETWTRTKHTLQYHQNKINAIMNSCNENEDCEPWMPQTNGLLGTVVQVKLLCGADLLESFATPGLWSDEDIEAIVGQHGLVVVTRENTNPLKFIYNSDILTKYMANIQIVTEWIRNEISSTKVRRSLRRSESVKYLIPDGVIEYIHKHNLYGANNTKYITTSISNYNSVYLTPSPSDVIMESPSSVTNRCLVICDNTFSRKSNYNDNIANTNNLNFAKHPGQAVKIISDASGVHKIIREAPKGNKEVCTHKSDEQAHIKTSRSCADFEETTKPRIICKSSADLKDYKACDENLIKFIFTQHGIQVISDVETVV